MKKLALLNTSIITNTGAFNLEAITLEQAKSLVQRNKDDLDSAIGHESTAQIMSELLGVEIPMNRQQFKQEKGQQALVFKLKGRPQEGVILTKEEIEAIGYEFQLLTMKNNSLADYYDDLMNIIKEGQRDNYSVPYSEEQKFYMQEMAKRCLFIASKDFEDGGCQVYPSDYRLKIVLDALKINGGGMKLEHLGYMVATICPRLNNCRSIKESEFEKCYEICKNLYF